MVDITDILLPSNNKSATLNNDLLAGDGSIVLTAGEGATWPSPGPTEFFVLTVQDLTTGLFEICYCTARSGDLLTVDRAQEGTSALTFSAATSVVQMRLTKGILEKHIQKRFDGTSVGKYLRVQSDGQVLPDVVITTGGAFYTGVNLGAGADVYKETDNGLDPREHKFRSIIAGTNVTVTQLADEIEIASSGGGGGTLPGLPPEAILVGSGDNGCALSLTSFNPHLLLPALQVGDLMVWCIHQGGAGWVGATGLLNIPVGWTPFSLPKYGANADRFFTHAILYKFADSTDVAGVVHSVTPQVPCWLCSSTFAYRGHSPDRPFSALFRSVYDSDSANNDGYFPPGAWGVHTAQPLLMGYYISRGNTDPDVWPLTELPVGPVPDVYHEHRSQANGSTERYMSRFATRIASNSTDENWIPSETKDSSLGGTGWTQFGISGVGRAGIFTSFSSTAVFSRHYFEFPVTLVAGEKYQFTFNQVRDGWNTAQRDMYIGASFVDPSNVERGLVAIDGNIASVLDPSTDHNTWWHARCLNSHVGGVPNRSGTQPIILFTAQASGVYKLRVSGIDYTTGNWEFNTGGGDGWKVMGVTFHKNWKVPAFVWSGPAGAFNTNGMQRLESFGWLSTYPGSTGTGEATWSTSINPNWAHSPPARMFDADHLFSWPRNTITSEASGKVIDNDAPFGYVPVPNSSPTLPVYPSLAGARQKYYIEVKCLAAGPYLRIFAAPIGGHAGHWSAYLDSQGNTINGVGLPAGTTTWALNDIVGFGIDFATSTSSIGITFYKNGVSIYSTTIPCSTGGHYHPDEPWNVTISPARASGGYAAVKVQVALTEAEQVYKPVGYLAWDPLYDPSASVSGGTPSDPFLKTISEGTAIDVTSTDETITISFDATEVANDTWPFSKLQNISTGKVLGRSTAGTGDIEEITVGTGLLLSGGTLSNTVGTSYPYYQQVVLGDGVARYYTCDDVSGLPVDLVGGTLTGIVGGTGTTYGNGGRGVRGKFVTVTTAGNMSWPMGASQGSGAHPAFGNCTLEAWFKSTSSLATVTQHYNAAFLVGSDTGGGGNYISLGLHNACRPVFGFGGGSTIAGSTGTYNDGLWHHVVATRNASTGAVVIYVDGAVYATGNCGAGNANSQPSNFWTGVNAIGFNGSVQHVAVYASILTASQVETHYRAGKAEIVVPVASGAIATDAIWDAKGDLAVGTGSNTAARLPVGVNTYVLTADSAEATGLKWAAPAAGGSSGGGLSAGALMYVGGTTVTGAAATEITVSGLDLDAHGLYFVELVTKNASASGSNINWSCNSDTTTANYYRMHQAADGGSVYAGRGNDRVLLDVLAGVGTTVTAWCNVRRNAAGNVLLYGHAEQGNNNAARLFNTMLHWATTGVNVTSMTFASTVAGALDVGSTIRIWRYVESGNGTAAAVDYDISVNPTAYDDEFKAVQTAALTGWTVLGSFDTLTTGTPNSALRMQKTAGGVFNVHGIYKAAPATPFTVTAKIDGRKLTANYQNYGLMLGEASPGKLFTWGPLYQSANGGEEMCYLTWTSNTVRTTPTGEFAKNGFENVRYIRLVVNSSTSIDCQISKDGHLWQTIAAAVNPGFTVGSFGLFATSNDNSQELDCLFDWIRIGTTVTQPEALLWQNVGGGVNLYPRMTKPTAASLPTWVNQGTATLTDKTDRLVFNIPTNAALNARAAVQSAPATPYTVTVAVAGSNTTGYTPGANLVGIALKAAAGDPLISFEYYTGDSVYGTLRLLRWPTPTTTPATAWSIQLSAGDLVWLRVTDDGTTRKYWYSGLGKDWIEIASEARTTHVTPDQVGIYAYNNTGLTSKIPFYHYSVANSVLGDEP